MSASISITWHTQQDDRVCPICKEIDGYTWTFPLGEANGIPNMLIHPVHNIVWTTYQQSQAHGHTRSNCRCRISYHLDLGDMVKQAQNLLNALENSVDEGNRLGDEQLV